MSRYPTDEELEKWIINLEKEELYAPAHLKEAIMQKAFETNQVIHLEEVKKTGNKKKSSTRVQMITYTLKIAVGMAAAIAFLCLLPNTQGTTMAVRQAIEEQETAKTESQTEKPQKSRLLESVEAGTKKLREKTSAICETLANLTNSLIMEDNNNEN